MKKHLFLLVLVWLLNACQSTVEGEKKLSDAAKNPIDHSERMEPTLEFLDFIESIEADGWYSDTLRVKKVKLYGLDELPIKRFRNRPFYSIHYGRAQVGIALTTDPNEKERSANAVLSQVKQIWGFYYRDREATQWISDGVIEQWSFNDPSDAQNALEQMKVVGNNIFFNTTPYFHVVETELFIFHTRAMAFSVDQQPLFEKFLKG